MEPEHSSETLVDSYQITRCHILEDRDLLLNFLGSHSVGYEDFHLLGYNAL
jgi:hypothetical protein